MEAKMDGKDFVVWAIDGDKRWPLPKAEINLSSYEGGDNSVSLLLTFDLASIEAVKNIVAQAKEIQILWAADGLKTSYCPERCICAMQITGKPRFMLNITPGLPVDFSYHITGETDYIGINPVLETRLHRHYGDAMLTP
jgi:hypothetical protein